MSAGFIGIADEILFTLFFWIVPGLGFASLFVSALFWRRNEYLSKALKEERGMNEQKIMRAAEALIEDVNE